MPHFASPSPARSHIEAIHRLLRLGTAGLALFAAFQAAQLLEAPAAIRAGAAGLSLDLSPSPQRKELERRFAPRTEKHPG